MSHSVQPPSPPRQGGVQAIAKFAILSDYWTVRPRLNDWYAAKTVLRRLWLYRTLAESKQSYRRYQPPPAPAPCPTLSLIRCEIGAGQCGARYRVGGKVVDQGYLWDLQTWSLDLQSTLSNVCLFFEGPQRRTSDVAISRSGICP